MADMKLIVITANVTGNIRRETLNGQEHIVAPITMIVPGVLNGNHGPLLYPIETLRDHPERWNGMPIVVDHPMLNGMDVSARDPAILNTQGIGQIFGTNANGKLTAEAWFNVEATRRINHTILDALERGNPFELSTGLITEPTSQGGTFNNEKFIGVVESFEPDHLAILIDSKGACSLQDGCGVLVNKTKEKNMADKVKLIDTLINEDEVWTEEDRESLGKFEDKKLEILVANLLERKKKTVEDKKKQTRMEAVANAAREGYKDCQGNQHSYNAEKSEWETTLKVEVTTVNAEGEPVVKETKPQTAEEWFDSAPPEIQSAVRNSMAIEANEKAHLVEQLVANVEDQKKKDKLTERLKTKDLEELRDFVALTPAVNINNPFTSNYVGAAIPAFNTEPPEITKPEPLGLPVWEF